LPRVTCICAVRWQTNTLQASPKPTVRFIIYHISYRSYGATLVQVGVHAVVYVHVVLLVNLLFPSGPCTQPTVCADSQLCLIHLSDSHTVRCLQVSALLAHPLLLASSPSTPPSQSPMCDYLTSVKLTPAPSVGAARRFTNNIGAVC
jgi:hypothetical protein